MIMVESKEDSIVYSIKGLTGEIRLTKDNSYPRTWEIAFINSPLCFKDLVSVVTENFPEGDWIWCKDEETFKAFTNSYHIWKESGYYSETKNKIYQKRGENLKTLQNLIYV